MAALDTLAASALPYGRGYPKIVKALVRPAEAGERGAHPEQVEAGDG